MCVRVCVCVGMCLCVGLPHDLFISTAAMSVARLGSGVCVSVRVGGVLTTGNQRRSRSLAQQMAL